MHSPQGWKKCGGGRVNDVQGHRCGGRARDGLGGKGGGGGSTTGKQSASSNTFLGHHSKMHFSRL